MLDCTPPKGPPNIGPLLRLAVPAGAEVAGCPNTELNVFPVVDPLKLVENPKVEPVDDGVNVAIGAVDTVPNILVEDEGAARDGAPNKKGLLLLKSVDRAGPPTLEFIEGNVVKLD